MKKQNKEEQLSIIANGIITGIFVSTIVFATSFSFANWLMEHIVTSESHPYWEIINNNEAREQLFEKIVEKEKSLFWLMASATLFYTIILMSAVSIGTGIIAGMMTIVLKRQKLLMQDSDRDTEKE